MQESRCQQHWGGALGDLTACLCSLGGVELAPLVSVPWGQAARVPCDLCNEKHSWTMVQPFAKSQFTL